MPRTQEKYLFHWNSNFKNNADAAANHCAVNLPNHNAMHDCLHCAVKAVTITHVFKNIYAGFRTLYIRVGGVVTLITLDEQNVTSFTDLRDKLQVALQAELGGTVVVSVTGDGVLSMSSTVVFDLLSPREIVAYDRKKASLNSLIGADNSLTTFPITAVAYQLPTASNLTGVRLVRLESVTLGSGRSIHGDGSLGSNIATISLADVDYGFSKTTEFDSSSHNQMLFRSPRDIAHLDIKLYDEYEQPLTLPDNAPLDVEFIFTSLTI